MDTFPFSKKSGFLLVNNRNTLFISFAIICVINSRYLGVMYKGTTENIKLKPYINATEGYTLTIH